MSMPDRKFPIVWTAWLLAIIVSFAVLEGLAVATGGTTLSRYTWEISKDWPLLPFVLGLICGALATHFWWHWLPPGSDSEG